MNSIKQEPKFTASERTNILFATLFYYVAGLVGTAQITTGLIERIELEKLNSSDIIVCADKVLDIFRLQGGNDKTAKNSDFTKALIVSFEKEWLNSHT